MWRTGFDYIEARPALLRGYHRCLCVYSIHYRGTPEKPGLVLGLDRGGSCRGRAFRVAAETKQGVLDYLYDREMIHGVYDPRLLEIELDGGGGKKERAEACVFVMRRNHDQYTGKLTVERAAELVMQGEGCRGKALEYLENTVAHLQDLGIRDKDLEAVLGLAKDGS